MQTIKELQIEKQTNVSESTTSQQISSLENQLSNALTMNHNLENELTQEILYLQNELRNSGQQHVKANHDSIIIESLKADLAEAHRLKDESVSAVQADFDTLKKECDKSITSSN